MVVARPVNPEAYEAYLKGRFHLSKRTPDGIAKSIEYFKQAIALAPDWPLGHAGLADAYVVIPQYASMPSHDAMPRARAAAAKALELDESLGEAHATLALIAENYDWNWPMAEHEFRRALALSPNYATAHHWYALYLQHMGRYDEAVEEMAKASELDPLSLIIGCVVGMAHRTAGHPDRAELALRRTLDLGPDFALAHMNLGLALYSQGSVEEGITEVREAVRLSGGAPMYTTFLAFMCAKNGQPEVARSVLQQLTAQSKRMYVAPVYFARVHAGLGDTDRMFEWLEKAYEERDSWLTNMLIDPFLKPMRADPRFADLVRRVGMPMPTSTAQDTGESGRGTHADRGASGALPVPAIDRPAASR
jgi:tetratricopeptide (TPR) repeat protein